MTTALTKKEQAQIQKYGDLMDDTAVDASDILIPKLLLMQAMSKMVQEEKARSGEIRGSTDQKKLAEKEGSVEIIPFKVYKTWVTLKKKGNEFFRQEPFTIANAVRPREEIIDGEECLNYETLNYYCLLPEEIKEGVFMPYVVSFRSTSYMAGKALETNRARLKEFGKPLCFKTFNLGSEARSNDHGNFYVYTISEARNTTDQELDAVKHWNHVISQGNTRVDESDLEAEAAGSGDKTKRGEVNTGDEY